MRKIIFSMVLAVMMLLVFVACDRNVPLKSSSSQQVTQEEFRQEFLQELTEMRVMVPEEPSSILNTPKTKFSRGEEIYKEDLEVTLHIYELVNKQTAPNVDDLMALYDEYNDAVYTEFKKVHYWYVWYDGRTDWSNYSSALIDAKAIYKEDTGKSFFPNKTWSELTAAEKFALEDHVKENPCYDERQTASYRVLLRWLGLENPSQSEAESLQSQGVVSSAV